MRKVRKTNGITLIALVITIIVLLILAGVSIAMLTGDNGILTQAQNAKNETIIAEQKEKNDLSKTENMINEYMGTIKVEQVKDENPGVLEGSGTDIVPYVINSIEDLVFFAYDVTNGNSYEGKIVELGTSLDFNSNKSYVNAVRTDYGKYGYDGELKTLLTSGEGFKPIGTTFDTAISEKYFMGTFDGKNKTIYNLYQDIENSEYVTIAGLFSTNTGIIKNLKLDKLNIKATTSNLHLLVGAIAGRNNGNIEQVSTSGNINIIAEGIKGIWIGGINGQSTNPNGNVNKSSSNVNINITSTIESTNPVNVYGIGQNNEIKNCYFAGNIKVTGKILGIKNISGIGVGISKNCYNIGKIESKTNYTNSKDSYISGIIHSGSTAINSYNIGEIICENPKMYISGVNSNAKNGEFNNCYNVGEIKGIGTNIIGGSLIGYTTKTKIINSKWLTGTFNKAIANKGPDVTEDIEEINNIENMPSILSVINQDNCFKEDENNINNGYPILNWQ